MLDQLIHVRDRLYSAPGIVLAELVKIEEGLEILRGVKEDHVRPPWPGPERRSAPYVWSGYSSAAVLTRSRAVYSAALEAYFEIVCRWFPRFKEDLSLASKAPFTIVGAIARSIRPNGLDYGFGLDYYLGPNAGPSQGVVEFELTDPNSQEVFREESFRKLESGEAAMLGGDSLDIFDLDAAEKLAYEWLDRDLRDVGWA